MQPLDLTAPGDPSLAPGPGLSTKAIIQADDVPPPPALTEQSYSFLGDQDIPFARYTDEHFYQQEQLDSIEYFAFPNACFFPGVGIPLIYRFRPLDVDHCIHDEIRADIGELPRSTHSPFSSNVG